MRTRTGEIHSTSGMWRHHIAPDTAMSPKLSRSCGGGACASPALRPTPDPAVRATPDLAVPATPEPAVRGSLVAAPLLAVLRHAFLDRLPDAAPRLPQRLPRLLGEVSRTLRRSVRPARQTAAAVTISGRARTGGGRLIGPVAGLSGRWPRPGLIHTMLPMLRHPG
ncbi:hypothetical protein JOD64_003093 [Micromonospora luteifusca]|uniref:Uncharacterized protein n=1 Tax=Micromonospora luteifusca TaxID=709860 RepID=A0ABS2LUK8_9ACTN|nr:hypothetical protein [Micromonospora luteifusca]